MWKTCHSARKESKGLIGLLFIAIVIAVAFGILLADGYGQSTDEPQNAAYGASYLAYYLGKPHLSTADLTYYHGPFYFILFTLTSKAFSSLLPSWSLADGRHFTNYLAFLLGVASFYLLAKRLVGTKAATWTTLLFATQPLLFGHAFINQKDIPFMAFFTTSLAVSVVAADKTGGRSGSMRRFSIRRLRNILGRVSRGHWGEIRISSVVALLALILFTAGLFALIWCGWGFPRMGSAAISAMYGGEAHPVLVAWFREIAQGLEDTPLLNYQERFMRLYEWVRIPLSVISLLPLCMYLWRRLPEPRRQELRVGIHRVGWLVLAGTIIGLTAAIRIIGIYAGVLAALYFLLRYRVKAMPHIVVLALAAAAAMYLAWPALWPDPLGGLIARLRGTAGFSDFQVFYDGHTFLSQFLPWHYLPKLLAFQLSPGALALILVGCGVAISKESRRQRDSALWIVLSLWFWVPLIGAMAGMIPIYNNFRQLLFLLPPLFCLAAYGLAWIAKRIRRTLAWAILIFALLFPNLIWISYLHPYEYVYYNVLAGGINDASDRYLMDYWCTSVREAMEFVNLYAPEGADVAVYAPIRIARSYARDDLNVYRDRTSETTPDFAVGCADAVRNEVFFPQMKTVYEVKRGGAVLSLVKSSQAYLGSFE